MNLNHPNLFTHTGLTEADFDDTAAARRSAKLAYIPAGCDQQGRVEAGARARCSNPAACTMPLCVCRPAAAEASNELCLGDDGEPWEPAPPASRNAIFGWVALGIVAAALIIERW